MTYDKPFKTLDEQIELLKSRGLIITDKSIAKQYLITASYYDLVNGFKDIYMPKNKFINNITIEGLFQLSYIDKSVQSFIMKYSLMIEVKFKNCLAYILSKNIGVHQNIYLNPKNYKSKANKNLTFKAIKDEINKQLIKAKAKQPTKHYLNNHNHVPPWILLKNLSLGSAINLFKCLTTNNKQEFAELFIQSNKISTKEKINLISSGIDGIRLFRNAAAHNLNFVKCRLRYDLPNEILFTLLPKGAIRKYANIISKKDRHALQGIFGIVLLIYIFLNDTLLCTMLIHELSDTLISNKDHISPYYKSYCKLSEVPQNLEKRISKLVK